MKTSPQPDESHSSCKPNEKVGPLLKVHRTTVESTQGMTPAVLLGSSFALAMGGFAWLGHRWDEKTGNEPWGVLTGVFVGFLYGGYEVWKVIRPMNKEPPPSFKEGSDDSPNPPKG